MKKLDDLYIDKNTLKIDQMTKKGFGWASSKNGVGSLVTWL